MFSICASAETHSTVRKENGEEVYETNANKTPPLKKKEEHPKKADAAHDSKDAHNNPPEKKAEAAHTSKEEHADSSHNPTPNEKDAHAKEKSKAIEEEHNSSAHSEKYKSNKLVTLEEEDPYEVRKPLGIFWFAGVFLTLLIVIFIFT